jgi:DNA-binding XRE family transcriptional regulator
LATRYRRVDLERYGPMLASSKLPSEERPTKYTASGFRAAREAAAMTVDEVAALCGYSRGVILGIENGGTYHTLTISRAASMIPNHNLSLIRDE